MNERFDIDGTGIAKSPSLPGFARSPINRCNLPAVILGSLTFQRHPARLFIDGARELHAQIYRALDGLDTTTVRALHFRQYMASAFLLDRSSEAGFDPDSTGIHRDRANYLRLLRGWMFNADGIEAAVLKHWVESRFGLLAQNHRGSLRDRSAVNYAAYEADYMRGIYNTNALAAQIDLLYSFCQYEIQRRWPGRIHFRLYRGVNCLDQHDILQRSDDNSCAVLLNNLSSFSGERSRSDTFGDSILETDVPFSKLLWFPDLLPGVLAGEAEYLVIGGVYRARVPTL